MGTQRLVLQMLLSWSQPQNRADHSLPTCGKIPNLHLLHCPRVIWTHQFTALIWSDIHYTDDVVIISEAEEQAKMT